MTTVRLRGTDHIERAKTVCQRHLDGEDIQEMADEYGCHYDVMRRWIKTGRRYIHPDMNDRDAQRQEANSILWAEIVEATEAGDSKEVVILLDRLAKFNGLDHSHRVQEAKLHLQAAEIQLMSTTMTKALEGANVPVAQRREVLELMIAYANNS